MADGTIHLQLSDNQRQAGFELVVVDPEGGEHVYPIVKPLLTLGGPSASACDVLLPDPSIPSRQGAVHGNGSSFTFMNGNPDLPAHVGEREVSMHEMVPGEDIRIGACRLRLVDFQAYPAYLEGCSAPYLGRRWGLREGCNPLGRSGKRENYVSLEDPTVSRQHAQLEGGQAGYRILAESPTSVNGEVLTDERKLKDGDLIQMGHQVLRFRLNERYAHRPMLPQTATILFADVWDYTRLSETQPLEKLIGQMNELYAAMGRIIEQRGGLLLTFLGDALMAVFGSEGEEDAPQQAVTAAVEMQRTLTDRLNPDWEARAMPTLTMGVGINTGEVMVGEIGFTGKFELAAMGDHTNLAARIEKLTREYKERILISSHTAEQVTGHSLKSLGTTRVKGREQEVEVLAVAW